ncbi:MAG TPA: hypothetical protein VG737_11925, partial [Cyclobacteriaceae bacterium]|nr:hypothetical protein [Cyclobacteriaceae bacterium]
MPSSIAGFEYDIFISYRHNDNLSGWVTEFVRALEEELAATVKGPLTIYFDKNPTDGLLETHNVGKSLEDKLNCRIFIPIISQTYCDPKSFAWRHEFCAYNALAHADPFGMDIKLSNGNIASRILPVKIHDLDANDNALLEKELGGPLRAIEFIYREPGVNRPLKISDSRNDNLNRTEYRNQVNKVANSVKELISSISHPAAEVQINSRLTATKSIKPKTRAILIVIAGVFIAFTGYIIYQQSSIKTARVAIDKSIAVLPFADMSPNRDQEYFGDGIAEEIINVLAQSEDLKVISRSSSFQFKSKNEDLRKIGEQLGVATVLEGSIRKSEDNLRITAQLIDTRDGMHLWSRSYDRMPGDLFTVQDEIANAVSIELNATLKTGATARADWNEEAWKEYLLGWSYFNRFRDYERAKEHFLKSISLDSTHANVYTFLHICVINLTRPGQRDEEIPYLKKALQLDSNSAEARIALARQYLTHYQFKEAEHEMNVALKWSPKNVVVLRNSAAILRAFKKHDEAIQLVERA